MSAWYPQNPVTISLSHLLSSASFVDCADIQVTDATEQSSECGPQVVFAAIRGTRVDGMDYVHEAVARGASAVLVDRPLTDISVPQCVVPDVRTAYARLCCALAGNASSRLKLVGVTGTNGKSTVAWLTRSILNAAGRQVGLLGTVEYHDGVRSRPATLTTPDTKTQHQWFDAMIRRRTTHAVLEVSSHALAQNRIAGLTLDAAVVTNITHDHFDYHGGYEAYHAAKWRIVNYLRAGGTLVINADDPGSASLWNAYLRHSQTVTFGWNRSADVTANILEESLTGTRFVMRVGREEICVSSRLVGRHNLSNCLAATAAAQSLGVSLEHIATGIEALESVPGRLQRIDCGQPFDVFVDYAHTPDALRHCVSHLRRLAPGKLICVFGAGGDRDRLKRPLLGRAAAESHLVVLTSDNPRTELPEQIIQEVLTGIDTSNGLCHVEPDRAEAIQWALHQARAGDCVLVAGKGHETEQILGTHRIPFDDRIVIRDVLTRMSPPPPHILRQPVLARHITS